MPLELNLFSTLGIAPVEGTINATVRDPGGAPTTIIQSGTTWSVEVDWTVPGALPLFLAGTQWVVRVFVESMGSGPEVLATAAPHTVVATTNPTYHEVISIPSGAGSATPLVAAQSNLYKVVTVLTLNNGAATPTPLPVAGYFEGPVIQFY